MNILLLCAQNSILLALPLPATAVQQGAHAQRPHPTPTQIHPMLPARCCAPVTLTCIAVNHKIHPSHLPPTPTWQSRQREQPTMAGMTLQIL